MKPFEPLLVGRMHYVVPQYPLTDVKVAGRVISLLDGSVQELQHALDVVTNWRASHHFPMNTFYMTLKRRANAVSSAPVVAQRIKRLESIMMKLQRQRTMELNQMQDIAGCRAIMRSMAEFES
ncbi:MAG TPA: hypothetical protein VLE20_08190 [Blastocatellia bacterium]|nr:hypothetical protein [Blastocatellia bacterium]